MDGQTHMQRGKPLYEDASLHLKETRNETRLSTANLFPFAIDGESVSSEIGFVISNFADHSTPSAF